MKVRNDEIKIRKRGMRKTGKEGIKKEWIKKKK